MKVAVAIALPVIRQVKSGDPPPPGPGGTNDVLLLSNGTDALLLVDGTSYLKLASSS